MCFNFNVHRSQRWKDWARPEELLYILPKNREGQNTLTEHNLAATDGGVNAAAAAADADVDVDVDAAAAVDVDVVDDGLVNPLDESESPARASKSPHGARSNGATSGFGNRTQISSIKEVEEEETIPLIRHVVA